MCRTFFACNYGQSCVLKQDVNRFRFFFSWDSAQKSCQSNISTSTLQVFCLLICFFTCLSDFVLIPLWGRNVRSPSSGFVSSSSLPSPSQISLISSLSRLSPLPPCLPKTSRPLPPSPHLLRNCLKHTFSALFHGSFHPSLLSSGSLVLLLACKIVLKSGVHQETSSNRSVPFSNRFPVLSPLFLFTSTVEFFFLLFNSPAFKSQTVLVSSDLVLLFAIMFTVYVVFTIPHRQ